MHHEVFLNKMNWFVRFLYYIDDDPTENKLFAIDSPVILKEHVYCKSPARSHNTYV